MTTLKDRAQNKINEIKNESGVLTQDEEKIRSIGARFFQHLLSLKDDLNNEQMEKILANIPTIIIDEQYIGLMRPFSKKEIK